jgi:hypothetical protein
LELATNDRRAAKHSAGVPIGVANSFWREISVTPFSFSECTVATAYVIIVHHYKNAQERIFREPCTSFAVGASSVHLRAPLRLARVFFWVQPPLCREIIWRQSLRRMNR